MPPFNIVIPPIGTTAVADFGAEADKALAAYRDSEEATRVPPEQLDQVRLSIEAAKALVAAGLVGDGGVYAVLGGNANPGHIRPDVRLESLISIGIYQRPTPPPAPVAEPTRSRKSGGGRTTHV